MTSLSSSTFNEAWRLSNTSCSSLELVWVVWKHWMIPFNFTPIVRHWLWQVRGRYTDHMVTRVLMWHWPDSGHWPWHMMPVGAVPGDWACPASPNPSPLSHHWPSSLRPLSVPGQTRSHDTAISGCWWRKDSNHQMYLADIWGQPLMLVSTVCPPSEVLAGVPGWWSHDSLPPRDHSSRDTETGVTLGS